MKAKIVRSKIMKSEKGIGLVETLLALALSVIVITSMVSLSVYTLRTSTNSKLLLQSSKLANEEIELVRAYRDLNTWSDFIAGMRACQDPGPCFVSTSGGISTASGTETVNVGSSGSVDRYFYATDAGQAGSDSSNIDSEDDLIGISVVVSWTVGGDTKYAHNYTELSNWREN